MESKIIIILANSIKHYPGRCIAGMEYTGDAKWIRPVGDLGEGQISSSQMILDDGTLPSLLDIVEVPVAGKENSPLQPENWRVEKGCAWKRHADGKLRQDTLLSMIEEPDHLWLQPEIHYTDRVSHDYLQGHPPRQSLYLIKISKANVFREGNGARLHFSYHRTGYALKVTDPNVGKILNGSHGAKIADAVICVSLAPSFFNQVKMEDQHFKLVASIMLL